MLIRFGGWGAGVWRLRGDIGFYEVIHGGLGVI